MGGRGGRSKNKNEHQDWLVSSPPQLHHQSSSEAIHPSSQKLFSQPSSSSKITPSHPPHSTASSKRKSDHQTDPSPKKIIKQARWNRGAAKTPSSYRTDPITTQTTRPSSINPAIASPLFTTPTLTHPTKGDPLDESCIPDLPSTSTASSSSSSASPSSSSAAAAAAAAVAAFPVDQTLNQRKYWIQTEEESDQDPDLPVQNHDSSNRVIPRSIAQSISPFSATHPLQPNLPINQRVKSSYKLVNSNRAQYRPYFKHPEHPQAWPYRSGQDPWVKIMYPAGGHEAFPLMIPKHPEDEYRPLDDLMNVITTTLSYYLTPDQSLQLFSEPHPILVNTSNPHVHASNFRFLTQSSHSPLHRSPCPSSDHHPSEIPKHNIPLPDPSLDLSSKPLLKELSKAIRRRNGIEFLSLIRWYNRVIRHLIEQGTIKRQIESMVGLPKGIWETVLGQAYDRQVGPSLELLQEYETWSSNVYGELKPKFVSELIDLVDLKPGQVFVDLGSGIGNIVLQVALEVGCVSVGFEIMNGCNRLAQAQLTETVGRAHSLWGVNLGQPVLFQADFTKDPRVTDWLQQADVVLVNNQVFTPSLNESLTLLFLSLRDSTKIISLKPFIPNSFKINQRNLDSPLAILTRPTIHRGQNHAINGIFKYSSNSVSWTDNAGECFLTVVDRSKLIEFQSSLHNQS